MESELEVKPKRKYTKKPKLDITEAQMSEIMGADWNPVDFAIGLYGAIKGFDKDGYFDSNLANKNLIDLNNNPKVPTAETLKQAIINYKDNALLLQDFSEFMYEWDNLYAKVIDTKLNMLAFDISWYVDPRYIKSNGDFKSQKYKDDYNRVRKFMSSFDARTEFRNATMNMLKDDTYFCWLRDSYGAFNEDELDVGEYSVKKSQEFCLQMMPQEFCRISGQRPNGYLWDFDLSYFDNAWMNANNYDPSLVRAFNNYNGGSDFTKVKGFANSKNDINKSGVSVDGYYRTRLNDGAYVFKYDMSNFNAMPPYARLLRDAFNNDAIKKIQMDKDLLASWALILGEMKTLKDDKIGADKNPFTIDPKKVGQLLQMSKKMVGNNSLKQIALPLEETRLYQFQDTNSKMIDNKFTNMAGQSIGASSLVYSDQKLSLAEFELASTLDYESIARNVYPQFMHFLEYFVNKKLKTYRFKFKVEGSNLQFIRQKAIDNQHKLSTVGIQVSTTKWASLYGYDALELESMMMEAKYGDMQDNLCSLLNANTATDEESKAGNPTMDTSDLAEGGALAREYMVRGDE